MERQNFKISLRAARVNAGFTILEAAKLLGVGKDTLIKWEKHSGCVTADRQRQIALTYGVPIDRIFFGI